jgi:hypothetical protein
MQSDFLVTVAHHPMSSSKGGEEEFGCPAAFRYTSELRSLLRVVNKIYFDFDYHGMEIVSSLISFIRLMNIAEGNILACNETHSGLEAPNLVPSASSETRPDPPT